MIEILNLFQADVKSNFLSSDIKLIDFKLVHYIQFMQFFCNIYFDSLFIWVHCFKQISIFAKDIFLLGKVDRNIRNIPHLVTCEHTKYPFFSQHNLASSLVSITLMICAQITRLPGQSLPQKWHKCFETSRHLSIRLLGLNENWFLKD